MTIANELMIKAIQEITVSEGVNPRDSVIIAGGGAAGMNIMPIARELGCATVILPKTASAMSACGMQFSDIVFEQTAQPLHPHRAASIATASTPRSTRSSSGLERFAARAPGRG